MCLGAMLFADYKIELRAMYYGLGSFANNMIELRAMYYGLGSFADNRIELRAMYVVALLTIRLNWGAMYY